MKVPQIFFMELLDICYFMLLFPILYFEINGSLSEQKISKNFRC